MVTDGTRKLAATCRVCGRNLTLDEFRACAGAGHYCQSHLPSSATRKSPTTGTRKRSGSARSSTSRRGRKVSESGVTEYSCKAQFSGSGVIRSGRLTTDHASSFRGGAVFVNKGIGYGPGEIVTIFITDPEGRRLAERAGFECHT